MSIKGFYLALSIILTVLQGCNQAVPLETLCALPDWAEFDQEMQSAQISLGPWLEGQQTARASFDAPSGRSPASVHAPLSESAKAADTQEIDIKWTEQKGLEKLRVQNQLGSRDRDAWTVWSRKKLKRLQDLIDQVEYYPERRQARDEFSKTANSLVNFHGYAEQGRIAFMLESLRKIRETSVKGREHLCNAK